MTTAQILGQNNVPEKFDTDTFIQKIEISKNPFSIRFIFIYVIYFFLRT